MPTPPCPVCCGNTLDAVAIAVAAAPAFTSFRLTGSIGALLDERVVPTMSPVPNRSARYYRYPGRLPRLFLITRIARVCASASERRQYMAGTQLGVGRRRARSASRKKRASGSTPLAHVYLPGWLCRSRHVGSLQRVFTSFAD